MLHKTTETVFDYFNRIRGVNSAPLRSEIDPSELKSVLPDLFFLEMAADGVLRFRLAGTRMCLILGRELRNQEFGSIWQPAFQHKMRLAAETVLANQLTFEVAVEAAAQDEQSLDLEMLLLPLFSTEGRCDRIFGSLVAMQSGHPLPSIPRLLVPEGLSIVQLDGSARSQRETTQAPTNTGLVATGGFFNKVMHLRVFDGGKRD